MQAIRTKVVACATVIEEMIPHLAPGMDYQVLDFGLYVNLKELKRAPQESLDAAAPEADTILLGLRRGSRFKRLDQKDAARPIGR